MKLHGTKHRSLYNGILVEVAGFPFVNYYGCGEREAEKLYRQRFGLVGRRIRWN